MLIRFLLVLALLGAARAVPAQTATCPAEQQRARTNVVSFGTSPSYAAARTRYNLPTAGPADVRLLGGTGDAAVCASLHAWLEANTGSPPDRWHRTFYRVGNLYYVALTRISTPPSSVPAGYIWVDFGYNPLYILDLSFPRVAGVAM